MEGVCPNSSKTVAQSIRYPQGTGRLITEVLALKYCFKDSTGNAKFLKTKQI